MPSHCFNIVSGQIAEMGKQSENNVEHFPLVDTFYIDLQLFKIKKAFRRSSEWFAAVGRKVFCLS